VAGCTETTWLVITSRTSIVGSSVDLVHPALSLR
jgi:hypothetical protein